MKIIAFGILMCFVIPVQPDDMERRKLHFSSLNLAGLYL